MRKKIFNYFEMAGQAAQSKSDKRSFLLGSIAIRNDGTIVKSLNSATEMPNRQAHAEKRICSKLDYNATVFVARVCIGTGKFGLSKPCFSCMKALLSKKVKKIYYTINENEYGVIIPSY